MVKLLLLNRYCFIIVNVSSHIYWRCRIAAPVLFYHSFALFTFIGECYFSSSDVYGVAYWYISRLWNGFSCYFGGLSYSLHFCSLAASWPEPATFRWSAVLMSIVLCILLGYTKSLLWRRLLRIHKIVDIENRPPAIKLAIIIKLVVINLSQLPHFRYWGYLINTKLKYGKWIGYY